MGRLVAQVAVLTGIAPSELMGDGQMLATIITVLNENASKR